MFNLSEYPATKPMLLRYTYFVDIVVDNGHDIARHRSIDMAINVLTDADTETPCKYETVLQKNVPSVHTIIMICFAFTRIFISQNFKLPGKIFAVSVNGRQTTLTSKSAIAKLAIN